MSAATAEAPVARSYTRARRHPWVMGKLGEIRLWLGPYSRPQLVVAGVGMLVLGKTISWWWPVAGPLPLVGLGVAVWAARCSRIGGRVPEAALWGWVLVLAQPRSGRIGGRPARPRPSARLGGGFFLTDTTATARTGVQPERPARPPRVTAPPAARFTPIASDARRGDGGLLSCPVLERGLGLEDEGRARRPRPSNGSSAPKERVPSRPRSSLDLLLQQAGARSSERA